MWKIRTTSFRISIIPFTQHKTVAAVFILALCLFSAVADASLQDEMAVGRFIPYKSKFQIVMFHFEHGKTFMRFYEQLPSSVYLFPVFQIIVAGQLKELPLIKDVTDDELDDIVFSTTSLQGMVTYSVEHKKMIMIQNTGDQEKQISFEEEMKIIEDVKQ
ncbi:MAG: hypothetical protein AB1454_02485 [Candidatus Auribacterota bacterium]